MEESENLEKRKPTFRELCKAVETRFDNEEMQRNDNVNEHYSIRTSNEIMKLNEEEDARLQRVIPKLQKLVLQSSSSSIKVYEMLLKQNCVGNEGIYIEDRFYLFLEFRLEEEVSFQIIFIPSIWSVGKVIQYLRDEYPSLFTSILDDREIVYFSKGVGENELIIHHDLILGSQYHHQNHHHHHSGGNLPNFSKIYVLKMEINEFREISNNSEVIMDEEEQVEEGDDDKMVDDDEENESKRDEIEGKDEEEEEQDLFEISIQFGSSNQFIIQFPNNSPSTLRLLDLRQEIFQRTSIPISRQTLLFKSKTQKRATKLKMSENSQDIQSLGLFSGCTIKLIGSSK